MIVIPMLGRSSRFFNAGYTIPKYQLPLGKETVFFRSVKSFESYFESVPFLFLIRKDHNVLSFVTNEICRLGIKDFRIIEVSHETRGQAESVELGLKDYCDNLSVLIFNIDTIRYSFQFPNQEITGDGFLEVFKGEGSGWSFVEAGEGNRVIRTAEKKRISNLCSNGIYYFRRIEFFREAYQNYIKNDLKMNEESYIAPLYNFLIYKGLDIRYLEVDISKVDHCGIPDDYEKLSTNLNGY